MKKIFILFFLAATFSYAQKKRATELGKVTIAELQMTSYVKDSTANALVLEEND